MSLPTFLRSGGVSPSCFPPNDLDPPSFFVPGPSYVAKKNLLLETDTASCLKFSILGGNHITVEPDTANTYVVVVPGSTARRLSTTNTNVVEVPGSTSRRPGTTNTYVMVVSVSTSLVEPGTTQGGGPDQFRY